MGLLRTVAVFLLLGLPGLVWAQDPARHAILLDRSGSMRPYYAAGLIRQIGEELGAEAESAGRPEFFGFHSTTTALRQLADIEGLSYGDSTLLDQALDAAIQRRVAVVWMVTDNVQHQPGEAEAGNTEVFYRRLRSSAVKRVTILPILQPAGRAGIVVYAILLDDARQEAFDKHVEGARMRLGAVDVMTEPLRMKPLDRNTVDLDIVRRGVSEEVELSVGEPLRETLEIRFRSRFDHLDLVDVEITVVEAKPEFQPGTLLDIEKKVVVITPTKIEKLAAGGQTEQIYRVDVDLGEVNLKRGLGPLWEAAWERSGEQAEVKLEFVIRVPQKNFRMRQAFAQTYNAASTDEAARTGRVYAVDRLPMLMGEAVTEVKAESPLPFRIQYPFWPALVWIALFVLGLAAAYGLARFAMSMAGRGGRWRVTALQPGVTLSSVLDGKGQLSVHEELVGSVAKGTFVPVPGAVIVGADDNRLMLADEGVTSCTLRTERLGALTLQFSKDEPGGQGSASESGASTESGYVPEER